MDDVRRDYFLALHVVASYPSAVNPGQTVDQHLLRERIAEVVGARRVDLFDRVAMPANHLNDQVLVRYYEEDWRLIAH